MMNTIVRAGVVCLSLCLFRAAAIPALEINDTATITDAQSGYIRIDTTKQSNSAVTITFQREIGRAPDGDNRLLIRAKGESNGYNNASDLILFNGPVSTDYIGINGGNSQIHFTGNVSVAGGLNLDDALNGYASSASFPDATNPRVWFRGDVAAEWVRVGDGLTTTRFDKNLTITGFSEGDVNAALAVSRGKAVFAGDVVTSGTTDANIVVAGVTGKDASAVFQQRLDAGAAAIRIGGSDDIDARKTHRGNAAVTLASGGRMTAASAAIGVEGTGAGAATLRLESGATLDVKNIRVFNHGTLDNSAVIDLSGGNGRLVFEAGSAYENNAGAGEIILADNAVMEIHGGASAATATEVLAMFDHTSLDASSHIRLVGETGEGMGYVEGNMNLAAGHKGAVEVLNRMTVAGSVDLADAGLRVVARESDADVVFRSAVRADSLHIAAEGNYGVKTTFDGDITLDGYDASTPGSRKETLTVSNLGHNVFNGAIDTSAAYLQPTGVGQTGGHVVFAASGGAGEAVSEINNLLNVGNAGITVGYTGDGLSSSLPLNRVVLGSGGRLQAANIHILKNGQLELAANADATGSLVFGGGSYFSPNGHALHVTGDVDIHQGAILYMDPIHATANETKILDATEGIGGAGFSGLYRTSLSEDGRTLSVIGLNSSDEVYGNLFGSSSRNTYNAGQFYSEMMLSADTPEEMRAGMAEALQRAAGHAYDDPDRSRAAFSQLFGEHGLAGATATRTTAKSFSGSVAKHQSRLREAGYSAPGVAGATSYASLPYAPRGYAPTRGYNFDYVPTFKPNRVWAAGMGAWTRQDDRGGDLGYKYNSHGAILGYDHDAGNWTFGLAGAYSTGAVENNGGFSKTNVDALNLGVYGSYIFGGGFFADGHLGFGYSWNEVESTDALTGLRRDGDYHAASYLAGLDFGYRFEPGSGFRIIPSVGAHYTLAHQQGWSERGQAAGMFLAWYERTTDNYLSIPVSLKVSKTFLMGSVGSLTPEIRGSWVYEALDPQSSVRMGYVGGAGSTTLYGVDSGRSKGLLGAGLKARFSYNIDAFVDYNFEFHSGYRNHNLMGGLGVSF